MYQLSFWNRMTLKNSQITPVRRKVKWHVHAHGNDAKAYKIEKLNDILYNLTHPNMKEAVVFFFATLYVFHTCHAKKYSGYSFRLIPGQ